MIKTWLPRIASAAAMTAIFVGVRLAFRRWPFEAGWWPRAAVCASVFALTLAMATFFEKRDNERS